MPDETPTPFTFPDLPIVSVDPPKRKTETEKYGSFFYFGILGLVVVVEVRGLAGLHGVDEAVDDLVPVGDVVVERHRLDMGDGVGIGV